MLIILPKDGATIGEAVQSILKTSKFRTNRVDLHLPKFKFEMNEDISQYLSSVGIELTNIYMPITDTVNKLKVYQASKIEVDEEGTKAAAITYEQMDTSPGEIISDTLIDFNVNRPFAFIIKEASSGAILFMGKITNPSQEQ